MSKSEWTPRVGCYINQLRGITSALAHGFWHMSEFSNAYRDAFGELPSHTLTNARRLPAQAPHVSAPVPLKTASARVGWRS